MSNPIFELVSLLVAAITKLLRAQTADEVATVAQETVVLLRPWLDPAAVARGDTIANLARDAVEVEIDLNAQGEE